MSGLRDLYQEVILDHSKSPRNYRELSAPARHAEGYNPLCGDRVTVFVELEGDRIKDVAFQGSGCAISKASASMMTSALKGKTDVEAKSLFEKFHAMVTAPTDHGPDPESMGKLAVFAGVREYPARVKCASLAWHTLLAAINGKGESVSTE